MNEPQFKTLEDMIVATAEAVRPPERMTVSQAAEKYRWLNNPGSYVGPWSNDKTPYLIEPMDELTSLDFTGEVFVGPARTGKSDMFFNWLTYTAICDPADMMSVDMTQNTARDWSKGDLRKMLRHSKEVGRRVKPGRQNQNVHDIDFMSGMRLLVKWPVISELSGKTIPRLWIRDYDRMTQNVDGEGNPFDLTRKRAQTFGRYGMCVGEASPGFPVQNAKWIPASPHEAPPCEGLLSVYNRGDRRRWYWRCMQCNDPFEAQFKHFSWSDSLDFMEASEQVTLVCPSCGFPHTHDMKHDLNLGGKWIKDGQTWMPDGSVTGTARRSDIASFWLMGPAAAFANWQQIVFKYLQANDEYERTGSEESLKTTVNVDQGLPYTPKAIEAGRLPEELKDRAEDWGGSSDNPVVPEGVRFIVKTADVQARSFVIQTHGIYANGDVALIQFKKLRKSVVLDENGEWQPIDPAARPEDWDVLIDEINETYPLADGSGRRMRVKIMGCDSGGKDGVTANAYEFWRRLRKRGDELSARFHLMKGDGTKTAPRLAESFPDSQRKDRHAGARGDVPVLRINANDVKDQLSSMLGRDFPGGMVRFPIWAEDWLYSQLTTEIRTAKGWENPSRKRNEAWDLLVYTLALLLHRSIRFGFIDWTSPPIWAEEWDNNDFVISPNGAPAITAEPQLSIEEIAQKLG